jgi:hypothetical protein
LPCYSFRKDWLYPGLHDPLWTLLLWSFLRSYPRKLLLQSFVLQVLS